MSLITELYRVPGVNKNGKKNTHQNNQVEVAMAKTSPERLAQAVEGNLRRLKLFFTLFCLFFPDSRKFLVCFMGLQLIEEQEAVKASHQNLRGTSCHMKMKHESDHEVNGWTR